MEAQEKNYYIKASLIAFVVVLVIIGIFYLLVKDASAPIPGTTSQAPLKNPTGTAAEKSLSDIRQASKLNLTPEAVSETELESPVLPNEIVELINPEQNFVSVKKASFPEQKSGYKITYHVPSLIYKNQDYYINLRHSGWTIQDFAHTNSAGLVKLKKNNFEVQVEQSVIDESNLNVLLTIIETTL